MWIHVTGTSDGSIISEVQRMFQVESVMHGYAVHSLVPVKLGDKSADLPPLFVASLSAPKPTPEGYRVEVLVKVVLHEAHTMA